MNMKEPLLTIFSAPKPFEDPHISTIQRNAIRSWINLGRDAKVILLGKGEGIDEISREFKVNYFDNVATNKRGTPLISSMLKLSRESSTSPFFAIVNTDILLFPDILAITNRVARKFKKFVIAGQRWDIRITHELEDPEFFEKLRKTVLERGMLHPPMGSDFFIFPRNCYECIPDFAIGRAGWDNWMIYKARFERWPVIDASAELIIAHQEHDYSHLTGGQPHYRLPETRENVRLAGGQHTIFTLFDAQYMIKNNEIKRKHLSIKRILREIEISPISLFQSNLMAKMFYWLWRPRQGVINLYRKAKQIFISG